MKYKIGFHGYEEEKKGNLQPLEIGENTGRKIAAVYYR